MVLGEWREVFVKQDWEAVAEKFIRDPRQPTVRDYAREKSLHEKTCANRASREGWIEKRDRYWDKVGTKVEEKLADRDAVVIARDITQQLFDIQSMKQVALRAAGGGSNGELIAYEKPHEAVNAYEKLVKLERLLTDQSTENLNINDGRQAVAQLFQIIREEVNEPAILERIVSRLSELGGAVARVSPPADNLN